jgi:hypothetical protein
VADDVKQLLNRWFEAFFSIKKYKKMHAAGFVI